MVVYDTLDRHLTQCDDFAQAAVPMGMLLAWCTNHQLLSAAFVAAHERVVLRVRIQEISGSELLIQGGGDLASPMFSAQGNEFLSRYYERYLADYESLFGRCYGVEDSRENYASVAAMLTAHFMSGRQTGEAGSRSQLPRWLKWLRR